GCVYLGVREAFEELDGERDVSGDFELGRHGESIEAVVEAPLSEANAPARDGLMLARRNHPLVNLQAPGRAERHMPRLSAGAGDAQVRVVAERDRDGVLATGPERGGDRERLVAQARVNAEFV